MSESIVFIVLSVVIVLVMAWVSFLAFIITSDIKLIAKLLDDVVERLEGQQDDT